jgi:thioredoxin reductase (NADPH)
MSYELAIIGAGPAGYTASIYAGRSGVNTIVFDRALGGGRANDSPKIENFPGFDSIPGLNLMTKMQKHALKYADFHFHEEVKKIKKNNTFSIETSENNYIAKAIILCTGTKHRKLGVPGENELFGRGVSYCATCDGSLFKGKRVAVVGGGNAAVIESIYLKNLGCKEVYLIHRRDRLRAEKVYKEALDGVKIFYNSVVRKIQGKDKVESLELDREGKTFPLIVEGVFISIGEEPQNSLALDLGIELDEEGFIIVDKEQRTNVRGVYAAGDITGGIRQIITACAEGAVAALSVLEFIGKAY